MLSEIKREIIESSKNNNIRVYFDMDGVLAEYFFEEEFIRNYAKNYFFNKKPIKKTLNLMKELSKEKNIIVCILSICNFDQQKEEKVLWLKKNAPFLKNENIFIINQQKLSTKTDEKKAIKANFIKKHLIENQIIYLIDDDIAVLKIAKKINSKINVVHIGGLID